MPEKTITLEEFLTLPETKPASEYMNGQVVQKPIPQGEHSKLQGKLVTAINRIVEAQKIALALPALRCTDPAGSRNRLLFIPFVTHKRLCLIAFQGQVPFFWRSL